MFKFVLQSYVHLVFRDEKDPRAEIEHWQYWHSQQPNPQQRAFDIGMSASPVDVDVYHHACCQVDVLSVDSCPLLVFQIASPVKT